MTVTKHTEVSNVPSLPSRAWRSYDRKNMKADDQPHDKGYMRGKQGHHENTEKGVLGIAQRHQEGLLGRRENIN